ncbi:MAG: IS1634 family transposase, partial [Deltaproteobacteria bacterium]|nr:IS1634 family transposase [Deltaproteobacteria bacterium]
MLKTVKKLRLDRLISAKPCREGDIIVAVIVARICEPDSKLAMTRWWDTTTLPELLDLEGVDEDDIYKAMDWLLARQKRIEKKLAKRHIKESDMVLYDLTSSYFEGVTCPLARLGKSRDRKRNTLQINYGIVSTKEGCPISVSVYEGNTGDPSTLIDQANKVRDDFGINEIVLVGDRGMITQKQINELREMGSFDWITAMKTGGIRKLVAGGALQLDLFDERNLFEFMHPDYPDERLVACRNAALGRKRAHKRESMLQATKEELSKIRASLQKGTLRRTERTADKIGVRVGKVVNKYKMAKHVELRIEDNRFDFEFNEESIESEAALDGVYVVRTSLPKEKIDADETVRSYKNLTNVERAFKSLKSIDLMVRPIRHRTEDRVRSHIFLAMLTYYVQRAMRETLRPLLFADEDQEAKKTRDPVDPAKRSEEALKKTRTKTIDDATVAHSFKTLLHHMSTITRDICIQKIAGAADTTFSID